MIHTSFYDITCSDVDSSGNLAFEPLPDFTEIALDDFDGPRYSPVISGSSNVITTEPYSRTQLEVTTVSNEILFPEDMLERSVDISCTFKAGLYICTLIYKFNTNFDCDFYTHYILINT